MIPPWLDRIAMTFWERAGGPPTVLRERNLEPVIPLVCSAYLTTLPGLTWQVVRDWFAVRGTVLPARTNSERGLFGCVVAYRGMAALFLESALAADEGRVIVAHEFAHYLAEYLWPRERVIRRLGRSILPVLDGDRLPTSAEEMGAALAGVRFGAHAHQLDRTFDPLSLQAQAHSEKTANTLALELLAPHREVLAKVGSRPSQSDLEDLLILECGLPRAWAHGYGSTLLRHAVRTQPLSQRWGL